MPGTHLFEYAVIRVVPRVEREEFINVGVILYCPSLKFLGILSEINPDRLCIFSVEIELDALQQRLQAFNKVAEGREGTIGELPMAARFRWLTASRSTTVQSSPVHSGLCTDPRETLVGLFEKLVK